MSLGFRAQLMMFAALGLAVSGCGKTPAPAAKEVTAPAPAAVATPEPQYQEARKILPAVIGNGKHARPVREAVGPPKAPPKEKAPAKAAAPKAVEPPAVEPPAQP